ncbi:MAG: DNA repair protein RecN [Acidobacteriota bacterium]
MLRDLHVRNLAVLAEAAVTFGSGFNVLSGETGAGKSIVVDALLLLAGVRASSDLVRTGADQLQVTGIFQPAGDAWRAPLAEAGLTIDPADDEIVVRRTVSRKGRGRVFLNDQPVTLALLQTLAPHLLRIHGQREELGLIDPALQRTWLDRVGGAEARTLLEATDTSYDAWRGLQTRLERLDGDDRARRERLDFLRFQHAEIAEAQLEAGEDERLRRTRDTLRHAEAIQGALQTASSHLDGDGDGAADAAYDALGAARRALDEVAAWLPESSAWIEEVTDLHIRVGELAGALRARLEDAEADPGQLDAVETRLATIERLLRKYGDSCAAVLARQAEIAEERTALEADEADRAGLEAQVAEALACYADAADALSTARAGWCETLSQAVEREAQDLAMARARFVVDLAVRPREGAPLTREGAQLDPAPHGVDQVRFLFSPNPGEAPRPLAKAASGGELSRLYLAVQLAVRASAQRAGGASTAAGIAGPTQVFDEIDTGVGGAQAAVIGDKLARLAAEGGQIFAVTHLPQVASRADVHHKVDKVVRDDRTFTEVARLDDAARVEEIARMLAGSEVTELSRSHARELIARVDAEVVSP